VIDAPSVAASSTASGTIGGTVSNQAITYLVAICLGVFGLTAFCTLVVAPAITAYRRPLERVAVLILSLYVLAALIGVGLVLGAVIVLEWPRVF
jgi:hypothetical protein